MIKQTIDIDGYWKVIVVYHAFLGEPNTGFTYSDVRDKFSVVGISDTTSKDQLMNTIVHEAKHVQTAICRYYEVDEESEDAAYLIGYLVQKMYNVFKELI